MTRRSSRYAATPLKEVETADRATLCRLFAELTGSAPAPRASLALLRGNLAWDLQARAQGLAAARLRAQWIRRLSAARAGSGRISATNRPGTRLIRQWQGVIYEVTVLEKGYAWEGRVYRSLTPIATAITGTKWSGPRFFGLRGESA